MARNRYRDSSQLLGNQGSCMNPKESFILKAMENH